jgi:hypothetical protein
VYSYHNPVNPSLVSHLYLNTTAGPDLTWVHLQALSQSQLLIVQSSDAVKMMGKVG